MSQIVKAAALWQPRLVGSNFWWNAKGNTRPCVSLNRIINNFNLSGWILSGSCSLFSPLHHFGKRWIRVSTVSICLIPPEFIECTLHAWVDVTWNINHLPCYSISLSLWEEFTWHSKSINHGTKCVQIKL